MSIKYGRGKFETHPNYIRYMEMIVENDSYKNMPNARSEDGRINWQVSSGKTTSFYKYYLERFDWWVKKADELNLGGEGNSEGRFTIAARLIHPTGKRPCRLCGQESFVGYMYLNFHLARRWNKISETNIFEKGMDILDSASKLIEVIGRDLFLEELESKFPERKEYFQLLHSGDFEKFFFITQHIKSSLLSPGFMGNPPDRLDGFHDYGSICCRKSKDPGRSDENMRSYNRDRRAFKWWAEGDWLVADALYNSAGPGKCSIPSCDKNLVKVSPDHIGPLSCGFKQIPFFVPMCIEHNASKNRRFTKQDVSMLIKYEKEKDESVASWQVRALWDNCKHEIDNDIESIKLSNLMRSMQDYYLSILYELYNEGMALFLSYYLSPKNAYFDVEFKGLNPGNLTFESYNKIINISKYRKGQSARIVRIAFEELVAYNNKATDRKIKKIEEKHWKEDINKIKTLTERYKREDEVKLWDKALRLENLDTDEKEEKILQLIDNKRYDDNKSKFDNLNKVLAQHFNKIGKEVSELL